MHGVSAQHARSVDCPVCCSLADRPCRYVGGDDWGEPMSLFHASRYLAAAGEVSTCPTQF
jgi:hypothetical protein